MPSWAKWGLSLAVAVLLVWLGWKVSAVLVTLHVLVCFVLVIVIMLQSGNAAFSANEQPPGMEAGSGGDPGICPSAPREPDADGTERSSAAACQLAGVQPGSGTASSGRW